MRKLSILVIHNRYQQPGGEDTVVRAEIDLLRQAGHSVAQYSRHNAEIAGYGALRKSSLLFSTCWNEKSYSELRTLIRKERPDIAHCHNLLPLISPAAYYACQSAGIPVVQTLHNYRQLCAGGTLFHDGERCTKCTQQQVAPPFRKCYRNSRLQTGAVSFMLAAHRSARTWGRSVDAYLAPSRFCREIFVQAGMPSEKIICKPNFLSRDYGQRTGSGNYALFVGRLSAEKGVMQMLEAWRHLPDIPLMVAGDGPLYPEAWQFIAHTNLPIKLLGRLDADHTIACIKGARFLLFPSRWYEPFGMGLLEAASCGVPAIASDIGAIPELVSHQQTGLLFDPDNFAELPDRVRWAWSHPSDMEEMGRAARRLYLESFTAEKNYQQLIDVYRSLVSN
jgi:glycosyltransferase involved in cell wall biosynthesis